MSSRCFNSVLLASSTTGSTDAASPWLGMPLRPVLQNAKVSLGHGSTQVAIPYRRLNPSSQPDEKFNSCSSIFNRPASSRPLEYRSSPVTKTPAAVVCRAQRPNASSSFENLTFLVRRAPGKAVAASSRSLVSAESQLLIKGWLSRGMLQP